MIKKMQNDATYGQQDQSAGTDEMSQARHGRSSFNKRNLQPLSRTARIGEVQGLETVQYHAQAAQKV